MADLIDHTCDFCGDCTTVAISEQARDPAFICGPCAAWALDQFRSPQPSKPMHQRGPERAPKKAKRRG